MGMRILVAAASKHGSTAEIATALAAAMRHRGAQVDVVPPEQVGSVDEYNAVVLGSPVYRFRWLRAARAFVRAHEDALRDRDVFLFSSVPVTNGLRAPNSSYGVSSVENRTGARGHRMLTGKLDPSRLGAGERAIARMWGVKAGDFRDWDAIGSWATEIVDRVAERDAPEENHIVTAGQADGRR
jgi:menaquinone-dependent protoporphyrinogen oxidase